MKRQGLFILASFVAFVMVGCSVLVLFAAVNLTTVNAKMPLTADRQSQAVRPGETYFVDVGYIDGVTQYPRIDLAPGMVNVAILPEKAGEECIYEFLDPGQSIVVMQGDVQIVLNKASVEAVPPLPKGKHGEDLWQFKKDGLELWQGTIVTPTVITAW